MKVDIFSSKDLDYEAFVRLHRASFGSVVDLNRSEEIQNVEHFRWKYNPPAGPARIAVVYEGGQMVAVNSMMPQYVRVKGQRLLAWQSCDTATDPTARGKGCFTACIRTLADSLNAGEIFFGFPNGNSIHGFKKLGWTESGVIGTSFRFLLPLLGRRFEGVSALDQFEAKDEQFLNKYTEGREPTLEKNMAYLNWRYGKHPKTNYFKFRYLKNGNVSGVLVLRKVKTEYFQFTLIMELLTLDDEARNLLLRFANDWSFKNRAWPVGTLQTDFNIIQGLKAAYVPLPHQVLPKRHVLMGMVKGEKDSLVFLKPWNIHTGDWDGF